MEVGRQCVISADVMRKGMSCSQRDFCQIERTLLCLLKLTMLKSLLLAIFE